MRTMHGDFAWYHQKYRHSDAERLYSRGKDKSLDHLIHCPRIRRCFRQLLMQPAWPSNNTKEIIMYLQQLLSNPEDLADFLGLVEGT